MGVDFLVCDHCGDTFCRGGYYVRCHGDDDECPHRWCGDDCAEKDGHQAEQYDMETGGYIHESCSYCREETFTDGELLMFLLKHLHTRKTNENTIQTVDPQNHTNTTGYICGQF